MLERVSVAALVVAGVLLVGAGGGEAKAATTTWDQAAALADFPVYMPTRTLGLKTSGADAEQNECLPDRRTVMVTGGFGKPSGKGPQIRFWQANPYVCGNPGLSLNYRKVRIRGRKVQVQAFCEGSSDPCTLKPGRKHAWLLWLRLRGGKDRRLTVIEMVGSKMTFGQFVRVARSLRRVDVNRPVVQLTSFLSPDKGIWCSIATGQTAGIEDTTCATASGKMGGTLSPDGSVSLCRNMPYPCVQNWDPDAPVLRDGQRTQLNGFACVPAGGAMTCTVTKGAGKGKGFRIDATSVSEVSPAADLLGFPH